MAICECVTLLACLVQPISVTVINVKVLRWLMVVMLTCVSMM